MKQMQAVARGMDGKRLRYVDLIASDMSNSKSESKRKRGRPVKYTMSEEVAKSILSTPPKKPHEWQFMQGYKGDIIDLEG